MERLTRIKSIRKKCLDCSDGQADVKNCTFTDCQLYPLRMGKRADGVMPSKAIREYCKDCCCGDVIERRKCPAVKCPLWRYRSGLEDRSQD